MNNRSQPPAIRLTNITKVYTIHHEKPTLVEKFIKNKEEQFIALKNINLEIKKGERVGIIGPNGSGKTTLLKIITGITSPTAGTVETRGKIVSLIDIEAGFHPDLTGIQNVYLNGMLLGFTKKEIDRRMTAIISFANIRQFIDAPLFTYSEGMKLRLGFAIAVHAEPETLVLDEAVVAGDREFQNKLHKKISTLLQHNVTLVLVSHVLEFVEMYAQRVILLQHGSILRDGDTHIVSAYEHGIL